jgi:hypothetical protein
LKQSLSEAKTSADELTQQVLCLENELESSTANLLEEKALTAEVSLTLKENIVVLENQMIEMREKLELAQSVSATATAHHETAGMSQEGLEAAKKEMERSVSSINSQLGIKEAEISRLMALTLELNDRASRAEQVD